MKSSVMWYRFSAHAKLHAGYLLLAVGCVRTCNCVGTRSVPYCLPEACLYHAALEAIHKTN